MHEEWEILLRCETMNITSKKIVFILTCLLQSKYQAHINIEWCNQSTSIKYLFKYIHRGHGRITIVIAPAQSEEGSQVHITMAPIAERLLFHLPNEQYVLKTKKAKVYHWKTRLGSSKY
ncbi:hypothetical protein CR513_19795, partial [Mucuna pruriens]